MTLLYVTLLYLTLLYLTLLYLTLLDTTLRDTTLLGSYSTWLYSTWPAPLDLTYWDVVRISEVSQPKLPLISQIGSFPQVEVGSFLACYCWWFRNLAITSWYGKYLHYFTGFHTLHVGWCRISSINGVKGFPKQKQVADGVSPVCSRGYVGVFSEGLYIHPLVNKHMTGNGKQPFLYMEDHPS